MPGRIPELMSDDNELPSARQSVAGGEGSREGRLEVRLPLTSAAALCAKGVCGLPRDAYRISRGPKSRHSKKGFPRILPAQQNGAAADLSPAPKPARHGRSAAEMPEEGQFDFM